MFLKSINTLNKNVFSLFIFQAFFPTSHHTGKAIFPQRNELHLGNKKMHQRKSNLSHSNVIKMDKSLERLENKWIQLLDRLQRF